MAGLQLVDYGTVKPLSLTDAIAQWQQIDANKQQQKLNEMKMAEAEQNAPLQRRLNEAHALNYEAEAGLNQQKAHMQRVQFANNIAKQAFAYADKTGLKQGTPEYDQAVRQAAEPFRGAMSQAFGHADTGEPIDVNALRSLASMDVSTGATHNKYSIHPGTGLMVDLTTGQTKEIVDPATGRRVEDPRYSTDIQGRVGQVKALADAYEKGIITRNQYESEINRLQPQQINQLQQAPIRIDDTEAQALVVAAREDNPDTRMRDAARTRLEQIAKQQQQQSVASSESFAGIPSMSQTETEKAKIKTEAGISEAVGKEKAKAQFEAETDLPAVINKAETALKLISELQTHPGKAGMVGMPNLSGALGGVRGTKEASFNTRLAQIKGQTFLQAFDSLKGAGQITEIEGEKATSAIARLDTAQEEKEFDAALKDLSEVIMTGLANAKKKAGVSSQQSNKPDSKMQEWDALPSGAIFTTPEGRKVRKP